MITVLIGTYNRLETLERTISSYGNLTTPHEIVIVDNGTDDLRCLALLERLEKQVKKVYTLPGCINMEEATLNFNVAVRDQFETSGGKWFAISEADVCFDGTNPRALDAYTLLAKHTRTAVGPHLRVTDIPASYPLRSRVLACESRLLYKNDMAWHRKVPYSKCQIDTTFHLFPRTRFFDRLHLDPSRVGPPYDAMHLDWYLDILNPNVENGIYIPGPRPMGSWGKQWLRDFWGWTQEYGAKRALELLLDEPLNPHDLCNNSFLASWCYQYGHGCDINLDESRAWLKAAIPITDNRYYWPFEERWMQFIYDNDFSALGWDS